MGLLVQLKVIWFKDKPVFDYLLFHLLIIYYQADQLNILGFNIFSCKMAVMWYIFHGCFKF